MPKHRALVADDPASFEAEVIGSSLPVVVDFWATWCGPCRMVAPELDALVAAHQGELELVKVDVDANPSIAARYAITSIPTVGLFKAGKLVATSIGAKPRSLIEAELGLL